MFGFNRKNDPTWKDVSNGMKVFGWETLEMDKKVLIFQKGRQRIVTRKMEGDNWEVEYYFGNVMDDATGITCSRFAKFETMKLGFLK
jgi:hypothetical protein